MTELVQGSPCDIYWEETELQPWKAGINMAGSNITKIGAEFLSTILSLRDFENVYTKW